MQQTSHKPGRLVKYRDREWIVLPSDNPELTLLKPLGGSDDEITGVYNQLNIPGEEISETRFPPPDTESIGAFSTANLLFDASRLSFRNASGPFRCMGKLSFRPRAYQMVPLTMALKQEPTRLLVADDVGIGKTVEALVIVRELLERGDVKRLAVITPPHLCDQWQTELKDKLDIDADIVRSSTAAALDRKLPDDRSIFHHIPFQVISIDYIKSEKRKNIFLNDCPEMVIVDEAHTCARPDGAKSKAQQQRHSLVYDIANQPDKHLLLLTATPHSGKDNEFISLLGLLNKEFADYEFENIKDKERKRIARHFIQRKRENIKRWMKEITPFPERESKEVAYTMHADYNAFYQQARKFAREIGKGEDNPQTRRIRYWAALALLRGIMSSPAAGREMLRKREEKIMDDSQIEEFQERRNPVLDNEEAVIDESPSGLINNIDLKKEERQELEDLRQQITQLEGLEKDKKVDQTLKIIKEWLKEEYQPIIFCKYIATAKYVGKILKEQLPRKVDVQVITSELADEQRKEKIESMEADNKVLVATECLSEGINLQDHFTAVLHYDLPWNPNRIEQRDGRIDRFGQTADKVKSYLLWGQDNPIDETVLKVLIRKVRDIQKAIGVSIPLGEDSESIMDEVLKGVLLEEEEKSTQLELFAEQEVTNELERAKEKAQNLRSIFAHESLKPEKIEQDLKAVDEAIGDVSSVENFVRVSVIHLGATIEKDKKGYVLYTLNLPPHLKSHFNNRDKVYISFESPTPQGYRYIGRNHKFVEQLCQFMIALAFDGHPDYQNVARVSEIQTGSVERKTTIIMFRVRNVIQEVRSSKEVISEEMYLWGYRGSGDNFEPVSYTDAKKLLQEAQSTANLSIERQKQDLERELDQFNNLQDKFHEIASERAENLVEAHMRFKQLVGGRQFEKATPVLPPDIMGIYILVPKPKPID